LGRQLNCRPNFFNCRPDLFEDCIILESLPRPYPRRTFAKAPGPTRQSYRKLLVQDGPKPANPAIQNGRSRSILLERMKALANSRSVSPLWCLASDPHKDRPSDQGTQSKHLRGRPNSQKGFSPNRSCPFFGSIGVKGEIGTGFCWFDGFTNQRFYSRLTIHTSPHTIDPTGGGQT